VVFYGTDFYAEISLENYPFRDSDPSQNPEIEVHRYQGSKLDKGSRPDLSVKSKIV